MLQKLEFTLDHAYTRCKEEAVGSLTLHYGYGDNPEDILVMTVPTHPFWAGQELHKDKESILFHVRPVEDGIYETNTFNFEYDIDNYTNFHYIKCQFGKNGTPIIIDYTPPVDLTKITKIFNKTMSAYGVADNIDQIKKHFKKAINHPTNRIVITMVEIRKDNEPQSGGWRWHKWGQYIGTQEPQMEYIYDEPNIERVYCFHAHIVTDKAVVDPN